MRTLAEAQGRGALGGEVRAAETQDRLAYSTVTLLPRLSARFTDDSGAFAFRDIPPGSYRLIVRQIGYAPFDTVLVVADSLLTLRVALRLLAFELPPVTVVATATCRTPGPPDPTTTPELALIFDQLRENAARYRLLVDSYPFRYWTERILEDEDREGNVLTVAVDTLELRSDARWRYAPGRLLTTELGPRRDRERVLNLPQLADLADSSFHRTHCFWFGGLETLEGRPHVRVDFLAAARLRTPDVDGTALLDPRSYQLRQLTLRLTRPGRAARGVTGLEVRATFGELLPSLSVPVAIAATTTVARRGARVHQSEEQRLLRVEFLRQLPRSRS